MIIISYIYRSFTGTEETLFIAQIRIACRYVSIDTIEMCWCNTSMWVEYSVSVLYNLPAQLSSVTYILLLEWIMVELFILIDGSLHIIRKFFKFNFTWRLF